MFVGCIFQGGALVLPVFCQGDAGSWSEETCWIKGPDGFHARKMKITLQSANPCQRASSSIVLFCLHSSADSYALVTHKKAKALRSSITFLNLPIFLEDLEFKKHPNTRTVLVRKMMGPGCLLLTISLPITSEAFPHSLEDTITPP